MGENIRCQGRPQRNYFLKEVVSEWSKHSYSACNDMPATSDAVCTNYARMFAGIS